MSELSIHTPRTLWDPFQSLGEIHDEFDRLFNRLSPSWYREERVLYPAVDIIEEKEKYIVKAELAGCEQKDVKITLSDNVLTIQGERKSEYGEKKEGLRQIEGVYGAFERSLRFEKEVVSEDVTAGYKDGILTIDLPKSHKEEKEIEVKID